MRSRGRPATDQLAPVTKVPLLTQMRHDLLEHGALRTPTIVAMYLAYAGHAAFTAAALQHRWLPLRLPRTGARATGGRAGRGRRRSSHVGSASLPTEGYSR
jgi:hypothetical protein